MLLWQKKLKARGSLERGQGMTEYVVIVALVGVAAIAVYQFFGQTVRNQMAGIALEVAGQSASVAIDKAVEVAGKAKDEGTAVKGLGNYKNDNSR
jgi:Flp pilus assembly pilin Flp